VRNKRREGRREGGKEGRREREREGERDHHVRVKQRRQWQRKHGSGG
jgi:hypothetical protein